MLLWRHVYVDPRRAPEQHRRSEHILALGTGIASRRLFSTLPEDSYRFGISLGIGIGLLMLAMLHYLRDPRTNN